MAEKRKLGPPQQGLPGLGLHGGFADSMARFSPCGAACVTDGPFSPGNSREPWGGIHRPGGKMAVPELFPPSCRDSAR